MDSLSDIADTPDFPPADSLSQVPTIWDVSTGPSAHDKVSAPSLQAGSHAKATQTQTTLLLKVAPVSYVGLKMQGLPGGRGTLGSTAHTSGYWWISAQLPDRFSACETPGPSGRVREM